MSLDAELDEWRAAWQAETAVPPYLRQKVARQARFLRLMLAGDVLVTAGIGGWVLTLAVRNPRGDMVLLAAATWLFIAIAWSFRFWNSRGLWHTPAVSTADYVSVLMRGCRAQIAATAFGAVLYVCEMGFCLAWIHQHQARHAFSAVFLCAIGLASAAILGLLRWYRRRKRAELAWLMTLGESQTL